VSSCLNPGKNGLRTECGCDVAAERCISLEAASGDAEVACNENFNIGP